MDIDQSNILEVDISELNAKEYFYAGIDFGSSLNDTEFTLFGLNSEETDNFIQNVIVHSTKPLTDDANKDFQLFVFAEYGIEIRDVDLFMNNFYKGITLGALGLQNEVGLRQFIFDTPVLNARTEEGYRRTCSISAGCYNPITMSIGINPSTPFIAAVHETAHAIQQYYLLQGLVHGLRYNEGNMQSYNSPDGSGVGMLTLDGIPFPIIASKEMVPSIANLGIVEVLMQRIDGQTSIQYFANAYANSDDETIFQTFSNPDGLAHLGNYLRTGNLIDLLKYVNNGNNTYFRNLVNSQKLHVYNDLTTALTFRQVQDAMDVESDEQLSAFALMYYSASIAHAYGYTAPLGIPFLDSSNQLTGLAANYSAEVSQVIVDLINNGYHIYPYNDSTFGESSRVINARAQLSNYEHLLTNLRNHRINIYLQDDDVTFELDDPKTYVINLTNPNWEADFLQNFNNIDFFTQLLYSQANAFSQGFSYPSYVKKGGFELSAEVVNILDIPYMLIIYNNAANPNAPSSRHIIPVDFVNEITARVYVDSIRFAQSREADLTGGALRDYFSLNQSGDIYRNILVFLTSNDIDELDSLISIHSNFRDESGNVNIETINYWRNSGQILNAATKVYGVPPLLRVLIEEMGLDPQIIIGAYLSNNIQCDYNSTPSMNVDDFWTWSVAVPTNMAENQVTINHVQRINNKAVCD